MTKLIFQSHNISDNEISEEETTTEGLMIYVIPSNLCPDNITATIDGEKTTADVSWTTPNDVSVNMELPEGLFHFSYSLNDSTDCHFAVTVKGNWFPII